VVSGSPSAEENLFRPPVLLAAPAGEGPPFYRRDRGGSGDDGGHGDERDAHRHSGQSDLRLEYTKLLMRVERGEAERKRIEGEMERRFADLASDRVERHMATRETIREARENLMAEIAKRVTMERYQPVEKIVYGLVALILGIVATFLFSGIGGAGG
jgi:hypothetical protein